MKNIIICIVIMFSTVSCASTSKWSDEDVAMATLMTTATIIDWGQTRDLVKKSKDQKECTEWTDKEGLRHWECEITGGHTETNMFLGKDPSMNKVDTYMPLYMLANLAIADWLSEEYRGKYLYGMTFLEIGTIHNNLSVGLKVNF